MKICNNCKIKYNNNSQFCNKCGSELIEVTNEKKKISFALPLIIIIVLLLLCCCCCAIPLSTSNDDSTTETTTENITDNTEEIEKNTTKNANEEQIEETKEPENVIDKDKSMDGYKYITLKDLDNHSGQIIGEKIITFGEFGKIENNSIYLSVPDTVHYDEFILAEDSKTNIENLAEDTTVVIIGTVKEESDMGLYTCTIVNNCYVISFDSSDYVQLQTDEKISSKFTLVQDEIKTLGIDDYKKNCKKYSANDWEEIVRNPDAHSDEMIKFSGKIDQIIEGWFDTYTFYILDDNDNKWECSYTYKKGESHKLEGDSITVWGNLDGTTTSTTLLGKQVTMPYIDVKYIK